MLGDKKDCYALSDLSKPMEMLYSGIIQYVDGIRMPMLERSLQDYKTYF